MSTRVRRRGPARIGALAVLLAAVIAVVLVLVLPGGRGPAPHAGPTGNPLSVAGARSSALAFLDRYELADGRVSRLDQGGDTVSEGQSYAMLISVSIGDRIDFMRAWNWTRAHLQQTDGLLAYHWQDGRVTGTEPASDADLDAAHALVWAAQRFDDPSLMSAGRRIATAILAHETITTSIGPVLLAGPWAVSSRTIDPSYFSPADFQALYRATGDATWRRLEQSSYTIVNQLTSGTGLELPPDWATLNGAGHATPASAPSGESVRYSYDALRVPVRMEGSRTTYGVGMAARLWHFFAPGTPAPTGAAYTLAGQVLSTGENPEMLAGAAASAFAAGRRGAARRLLAAAVSLAHRRPSYYGWAILALTQLDLTDRAGGAPL